MKASTGASVSSTAEVNTPVGEPAMEWFCDLCNVTIPEDELRWDCQDCATEEWCCCEACFASGGLASTIAHAAALVADGSEIQHPHPLQKYSGPGHASAGKLPRPGSLEKLHMKLAAEANSDLEKEKEDGEI